MIVITVVTVAAILTTAGGGYLFGVHLGRKSRQELIAVATTQSDRVRELELQLASQASQVAAADRVRDEMRSLMAPLVGGDQQGTQLQELQEQMRQLATRVSTSDRSGEQLDGFREELHRTLAPLLERERASQQDLREFMSNVLSPLMENERRGQALQNLSFSRRGREQLPTLLDSIARRGGFSALLVSDEVGLPLAASSGAKDADVLAGVSSLILTLADRVTQSGGATPNAVLVRDVSNTLFLHRIFTAGEERFLVTAVARGGTMTPESLDPALVALENALSRGQAA